VARKTLSTQLAEKQAQLGTLREEIAKIQNKAANRIGRLAVRAGLADLDIEDADFIREFQAIAARFRGGEEVEARQGEAANGEA
jgi:hypothetical protein